MDELERMRKMVELDFLSGKIETMNDFTDLYAELMHQVDKETLSKMQRLLFQQFIFLFNEWRKEKAKESMA